jgi:hypothetical protein
VVERSRNGLLSLSDHQIIQSVQSASVKYITDSKARGTNTINISREIAAALVHCLDRPTPDLDSHLIQSILQFNTNKERLEMELRIQFLALVIDLRLVKDSLLHVKFLDLMLVLSNFFGKSFCFKFQAVLKEATSQQLSSQDGNETGAISLP